MFFESWLGVLRVVIIGILAYAALVLVLRLSGKRTLAKWNAFDFIVTVALGSTLATVLLSKDIVFIEGLLGFVLLVGLQYAITSLSVSFKWVDRWVKAEPQLLLRDGEFLSEAMTSERVTESEVLAAIRASGSASVKDIKAVILETDGSFSVIKQIEDERDDAMRDVGGFGQ